MNKLSFNKQSIQLLLPEFLKLVDKYHGLKVEQILHQNQPNLGLVGVVPVTLGNQQYTLPIKIIINKNYPNSYPLAFVNPSAEHMIKPTDYVDSNGFIKLPIYSKWNINNLKAFNLSTIVEDTQTILAIQNPIFMRPKNSDIPIKHDIQHDINSLSNKLNNDVKDKLQLFTTYLNSEDDQINLLNSQLKIAKEIK